MNTRFVTVDREFFCKSLEDKGFALDPTATGELVYVRQHHLDSTMYVKIYTSLPINGGNSRSCGSDAIRVVLIFSNPRTQRSGGLFKAPRVYRTGSQEAVVERTLQRARQAYAFANARIKG